MLWNPGPHSEHNNKYSATERGKTDRWASPTKQNTRNQGYRMTSSALSLCFDGSMPENKMALSCSNSAQGAIAGNGALIRGPSVSQRLAEHSVEQLSMEYTIKNNSPGGNLASSRLTQIALNKGAQ